MTGSRRKLLLGLRRRVQVRRRVATCIVEQHDTYMVSRLTCTTCLHSWTRRDEVARALQEKMTRYWNDGGTSAICPHCTKAERDRRYPLSKKEVRA